MKLIKEMETIPLVRIGVGTLLFVCPVCYTQNAQTILKVLTNEWSDEQKHGPVRSKVLII